MGQNYNPNGAHLQDIVAPGVRHQSITKSDSTTYVGIRALRIGGAGDVVIVDEAGTSITYTCVAGEVLQFSASKIMNATTATAIVAWF